MDNKFTVSNAPAVKVTVTISRHQLWVNFVECWRDMVWDDYTGVDSIKEVADVLLAGEPLDQQRLRKLFRDGWTTMLLADAMEFIDVPRSEPRLLEIVVTDEGPNIVIRHNDINY